MSALSASKARRATGSMIFSLFGGVWVTWWSIQAYGVQPGLLLSIATITGVLFAGAVRQVLRHRHAEADTSPASKRTDRIFHIVNILQGLAIFIAANVTSVLGHKEWFKPAFIFIVGAHFFPLAAVLKARRRYLTGGAMILVAVIYPFVSRGGPADPIGCLGAGLILWASSLFDLLSTAD